MKKISTDKLKIGDWVLEGTGMKGKFKVARVKQYVFDNFEKIDLEKWNIEDRGDGIVEKGDGVMNVLNKKEIKALQILRTKLKTLKGLEDDQIKRRREF